MSVPAKNNKNPEMFTIRDMKEKTEQEGMLLSQSKEF